MLLLDLRLLEVSDGAYGGEGIVWGQELSIDPMPCPKALG